LDLIFTAGSSSSINDEDSGVVGMSSSEPQVDGTPLVQPLG
jgi:hypothetical protein